MSDINTYANDRLIDFADALHAEIARTLKAEFGQEWLSKGVRKHFPEKQFSRVERSLTNPMRVIDMDRKPEEIHGLEHFWTIVNGNWQLFSQDLRDRTRAEAYLSEISEMRHNLAHRRKRHVLLNHELLRVMGNCRILLRAFRSNESDKFDDIVDSLSSGAKPWGASLHSHLPPIDDFFTEFVGRPNQLDQLSDWLESDRRQILVWGYGGSGKSALAYKFARDVRDSGSTYLDAVCWVSAKKEEYRAGSVRKIEADFGDKETFVESVWSALYGADTVAEGVDASQLLSELETTPILLVVDDFDTVSTENEELGEFLLDLRNTRAKIIYTSRHRGEFIRNLEVPPFEDDELREFMSLKAVEYDSDPEKLVERLSGIRKVTGGYPLFVDDLVRHAALVGVRTAMETWSQRTGDAAREYALKRQAEYLGGSCGEVLIALSVANRAMFLEEISSIAGLTDEDTQAGLNGLLRWRMVSRRTEHGSSAPSYRMNPNTTRLVQQTFREDGRRETYSAAFRALTGERVPEAKRRAIAKIVTETQELQRNGKVEAAKRFLESQMVGELKDSSDLYGILGWLCARRSDVASEEEARGAFKRSHELGGRKVDTYFHWATMEKGRGAWKECERICEMGIARCGASQPLLNLAGYAASREAKDQAEDGNYAHSQGVYSRALTWYRKALGAPVADVGPINQETVYRGMVLAFEALGDEEELVKALRSWHNVSTYGRHFDTECTRLMRRYPAVRTVPEFQYILGRM